MAHPKWSAQPASKSTKPKSFTNTSSKKKHSSKTNRKTWGQVASPKPKKYIPKTKNQKSSTKILALSSVSLTKSTKPKRKTKFWLTSPVWTPSTQNEKTQDPNRAKSKDQGMGPPSHQLTEILSSQSWINLSLGLWLPVELKSRISKSRIRLWLRGYLSRNLRLRRSASRRYQGRKQGIKKTLKLRVFLTRSARHRRLQDTIFRTMLWLKLRSLNLKRLSNMTIPNLNSNPTKNFQNLPSQSKPVKKQSIKRINL